MKVCSEPYQSPVTDFFAESRKGSALDVSHDFGYTSLNHIKGILPNMENILLNITKKLIQVLLPC